MRANELRIGNLVLCFGMPIVVDAQLLVKLTQIEAAGKKCIDISPMPIVATGREHVLHDFMNFKPRRDAEVNTVFWLLHEDGKHLAKIAPFQYVHEWQNLYYLLTGEEFPVTISEDER